MNIDSIPILDLIISLLLLTTITITYITPQTLSNKQEVFQNYYKYFILQQKILHNEKLFQCKNITLNEILKLLDMQYPIKIINSNDHIEIIIKSNEKHVQIPVISISCGDINVEIYGNT
ncbi:MAG: hypothetical protein ACP5GU_01320 [Thermoprotei archaeon]|jgi:hypothetical protein